MFMTIFGGGSMGNAIAVLSLQKGLLEPLHLTLVERIAERRETLKNSLGCHVRENAGEWLGSQDMIVLAVKPQDMASACAEIQPFLARQTLVLSIMAGVRVEELKRRLNGHEKVVRCMPNTPIQIGKGMTGYYAGQEVSLEESRMVESLLQAGGDCLRVEREEDLDAITAVSGSGPAYVYYIIESLISAARQLGFSEEVAVRLVAQTFEGAVKLWKGSSLPAEELRRRVTSKGGTTEAALRVFDEKAVKTAIEDGVKQARVRAAELSAGS